MKVWKTTVTGLSGQRRRQKRKDVSYRSASRERRISRRPVCYGAGGSVPKEGAGGHLQSVATLMSCAETEESGSEMKYKKENT